MSNIKTEDISRDINLIAIEIVMRDESPEHIREPA